MSGGHWDYLQYKFTEVIEDLNNIIQENQNERIEKVEFDLFNEHFYFSPEVIEKFKRGLELITKAQIYMQRIDWLLSGDDGETSFLRRLSQDLEKIEHHEN